MQRFVVTLAGIAILLLVLSMLTGYPYVIPVRSSGWPPPVAPAFETRVNNLLKDKMAQVANRPEPTASIPFDDALAQISGTVTINPPDKDPKTGLVRRTGTISAKMETGSYYRYFYLCRKPDGDWMTCQ